MVASVFDRCTRKPIPPESRYLGTQITDHNLVYDQESRHLGTEITDRKLVNQ